MIQNVVGTIKASGATTMAKISVQVLSLAQCAVYFLLARSALARKV
jgi:hypothetical protein